MLLELQNKLSFRELNFRSGLKVPFRFSGYKRRKEAEKKRGDVTILVVRDDGDASFVGAGYIEMKRRDDKGVVSSLKLSQMATILGHVRNPLIGLQELDSSRYQECVHVGPKFARVAVLPMAQVAINYPQIDRLTRFSTTLGHQIAVRFMNGADLHLSADIASNELWAIETDYMVIILASRELSLEQLLEQNPLIGETLQDFEDVRLAIDRVREGRRPEGLGR